MAKGCDILGVAEEGVTSCCDLHDIAYGEGTVSAKIKGDFALFWCILSNAFRQRFVWKVLSFPIYLFLALLVFAAVSTFGWVWWLKYKLF